MTVDTSFSDQSFVLARLLLQPIYREDGPIWETLRQQRDLIAHYFRQIGQELVIDEGEGYAFIRQIEPEAGDGYHVSQEGKRSDTLPRFS